MAHETKHTPGPWFDWEASEWLHEPQNLLTNYADACLIAEAPAMLEALVKARGLIEATAFNLHTSLSRHGKRNARPYFEAVAEIDALIARASQPPAKEA